jgi:hypothetical protein
MAEVLAAGVAMAGLGTALSINPGLPSLWRDGTNAAAVLRPITIRDTSGA